MDNEENQRWPEVEILSGTCGGPKNLPCNKNRLRGKSLREEKKIPLKKKKQTNNKK